MKILLKNLKRGIVKLRIENPEDLWYLSSLIEPGDVVEGQTFRKIKIGGGEDRARTAEKKRVFMSIKAEKVEFQEYSSQLRVLGTILEGPDDVPKGSYHSFGLEEQTIIAIIKEHWLNYQLQRLEEAAELKLPEILLCILDREHAYFARLRRNNYSVLSKIEGAVERKVDKAEAKGNFYGDVIKQIDEYNQKYKFDNIVVASPAFFKEDLMKNLKDDALRKKIVLATCSSVTENAFREVLARQELREVLRKDRISKEIAVVDSLLSEISRNGPCAYGFRQTKEAAEAGAVDTLLITDSYIQSMKQGQRFQEIDYIMRLAEQAKGAIAIIGSDNDGGKRLNGLGGIAAILRYKLW